MIRTPMPAGGCTGHVGVGVLRWWYWLTSGRPNVSKPIAELRRVTHQYEEREDAIGRRVAEKTAEAARLVARSRRCAGAERDTLRRQAMMALRQRGQLQAQLARTTNRHMAIEAQALQLEDAGLTSETLVALRHSSRTLQAHGKILDAEKVSALLSRLESTMDAGADLSNAFSEHGEVVSGESGITDDDLEAELDAMNAEADLAAGDSDTALLASDPAPAPAPAPVHAPPRVHSSMDDPSRRPPHDPPAAPLIPNDTTPLLAPPPEDELPHALRVAMA